jgi:hypothetical protein
VELKDAEKQIEVQVEPKPKKKATPKEKPEPKPMVPLEPEIVRKPYLEKCFKQWKRIESQKSSFWFRLPVDPVALGIPHYFEVVKQPMDLSTIKNKIDNEVYETEDQFTDDMRLVFSNAMSFNPPGTTVHIQAQELLTKFEKEFLGIKPTPVKVPELSELEISKTVLQKLVESEHSMIFREPVSRQLYPDYFKIISNPMDLQTVKTNLDNRKYSSLQQFHDDISLIFSNCFTFNKKGTFGYAAGTELKNHYQRVIKVYLT